MLIIIFRKKQLNLVQDQFLSGQIFCVDLVDVFMRGNDTILELRKSGFFD